MDGWMHQQPSSAAAPHQHQHRQPTKITTAAARRGRRKTHTHTHGQAGTEAGGRASSCLSIDERTKSPEGERRIILFSLCVLGTSGPKLLDA
mmetsp:Transcript_43690/g.123779  ORF Transcript_43690/g.123779 Transcript_43690/m.123779 type:complete len:92 (+) Transcript_43690:64-339(+)